MNDTMDRRSRDSAAEKRLADALATILDAPLSPQGRSLYRLHRKAMSGIAFSVLWTGVMVLFAGILRTSSIWALALAAPSLWYLWHSLRRPYAELML